MPKSFEAQMLEMQNQKRALIDRIQKLRDRVEKISDRQQRLEIRTFYANQGNAPVGSRG